MTLYENENKRFINDLLILVFYEIGKHYQILLYHEKNIFYIKVFFDEQDNNNINSKNIEISKDNVNQNIVKSNDEFTNLIVEIKKIINNYKDSLHNRDSKIKINKTV